MKVRISDNLIRFRVDADEADMLAIGQCVTTGVAISSGSTRANRLEFTLSVDGGTPTCSWSSGHLTCRITPEMVRQLHDAESIDVNATSSSEGQPCSILIEIDRHGPRPRRRNTP